MADGEKIGEVEDLLIDDTGTVRYLDVDLSAFRKHVLVPVARTRIDEAEDVVWVPGMDRSRFEDVPGYDHDPGALTADYERRLASAYSAARPTGVSEAHPGRIGEGISAGGMLRRGEPAGAARTPEGRAPPARPVSTGPLWSMSELGEYEVAAGDPDPRGWDVVMSDHRRVGKVHDLLIDPAAMKVRYLDCELTATEHGHPAGGRHVLIPVGYTRVGERESIVYVDVVSSTAVADLPSFPGLPIAPEDEDRIFEIFTRGPNGEGRDRS